MSDSIMPMPFPFCGATGMRWRYGQPLDGVAVEVDGALHVAQTCDNWWCVACGDCMAQGPKVKAPRDRVAACAVQAWNKRNREGRLF